VAAGVGTARVGFRVRQRRPAKRAVDAVTPTGGRQDFRWRKITTPRTAPTLRACWSLRVRQAAQQELEREELPSLYDKQEQKGPPLGMAIDLSSCVGLWRLRRLACQRKQHPSVGPEQVRKGRAMHWIRVDRYYRRRRAFPRVIHQPMLCSTVIVPLRTVVPGAGHNHSPDASIRWPYNRGVGHSLFGQQLPVQGQTLQLLDFTGETPASDAMAFSIPRSQFVRAA